MYIARVAAGSLSNSDGRVPMTPGRVVVARVQGSSATWQGSNGHWQGADRAGHSADGSGQSDLCRWQGSNVTWQGRCVACQGRLARATVWLSRADGRCAGSKDPAYVRKGPVQRCEGIWWTARGSNSRPLHCERSALPAELAARRYKDQSQGTVRITRPGTTPNINTAIRPDWPTC